MPAQLYLVAPPRIDAPATLADQLARLCAEVPVAAFRLEVPGATPQMVQALAAQLFPAVQGSGTAAIVAGDAGLVSLTGADGVHLASATDVAAARRALGPDISIGVACGTLRHDAMVAAEAGADYVEFGPFGASFPDPADPGLLTWWQELMELPCVAGGPLSVEQAAGLVAAGADFITVGGSFWDLAPGAQSEALAAFAAAAEQPFAPL